MFPAIPTIAENLQIVNVGVHNVSVGFKAARPFPQEYRLKYVEGDSKEYQEGKRIIHHNQSRFVLTQGGLKPNTTYKLVVVPYLYGIRCNQSEEIQVTTSKGYLFEPFKKNVKEPPSCVVKKRE